MRRHIATQSCIFFIKMGGGFSTNGSIRWGSSSGKTLNGLGVAKFVKILLDKRSEFVDRGELGGVSLFPFGSLLLFRRLRFIFVGKQTPSLPLATNRSRQVLTSGGRCQRLLLILHF